MKEISTMNAKQILAMLSLMCLPLASSAITYYVSPSGNDENDGKSLENAFTTGNGCLAADPKFVDPANGNFRLQPNSPCVNAGLNADWMTSNAIDPVTGKRVKVLDLAGVPRLYGSNVDIGCYEVWFPKGTIISLH